MAFSVQDEKFALKHTGPVSLLHNMLQFLEAQSLANQDSLIFSILVLTATSQLDRDLCVSPSLQLTKHGGCLEA